MIGYRKDPALSDAIREVWVPTDDLEDAALPPSEFVLAAGASEAMAALEAARPTPEGTTRTECRWHPETQPWPIYAYARPVLGQRFRIDATSKYGDPDATARDLGELVATHGEIFVPGFSTSYINSRPAVSRSTVEAVPLDPEEPDRGCRLVSATERRLKGRAAYRKGIETKEKKAAAEALKRRAEYEALAARRRDDEARLLPARKAVGDFNQKFVAAFKAACRRRKICDLAGAPHDDEAANLYAVVVQESHRKLRAFKPMIAAIEALKPADRERLKAEYCGAFALSEWRRTRPKKAEAAAKPRARKKAAKK